MTFTHIYVYTTHTHTHTYTHIHTELVISTAWFLTGAMSGTKATREKRQ